MDRCRRRSPTRHAHAGHSHVPVARRLWVQARHGHGPFARRIWWPDCRHHAVCRSAPKQPPPAAKEMGDIKVEGQRLDGRDRLLTMSSRRRWRKSTATSFRPTSTAPVRVSSVVPARQIEEAIALFQKRGYMAIQLPVSHAFPYRHRCPGIQAIAQDAQSSAYQTAQTAARRQCDRRTVP